MSDPYEVDPRILIYLQETAPTLAKTLTEERKELVRIIVNIESDKTALVEALLLAEAALETLGAESVSEAELKRDALLLARKEIWRAGTASASVEMVRELRAKAQAKGAPKP